MSVERVEMAGMLLGAEVQGTAGRQAMSHGQHCLGEAGHSSAVNVQLKRGTQPVDSDEGDNGARVLRRRISQKRSVLQVAASSTSDGREGHEAPHTADRAALEEAQDVQLAEGADGAGGPSSSSDGPSEGLFNAGGGEVPPSAADGAVAEQHQTSMGEGITLVERRRLLVARQAELRRRRAEDARTISAAWGGAATALSAPSYVALEPTSCDLPIDVGQGHDIILCGGYVGCARCGHVVGWFGHNRLATVCRGWCPPGGVRAVRRLAQGLLPHVRGQVALHWPSGEPRPTPRRFRRSAAS